MKNAGFHRRIGFALSGITTVWRRERSFRTQTEFAAAAVVLLVILSPGAVWCALVVFAIALVLALELVNSALEYLLDHLHPTLADPIRDAKDAAAGAVLLTSVPAAVIGGLAVWASLS